MFDLSPPQRARPVPDRSGAEVRSLRESPRAAVPTVAVTGEGKDRWATNRKLLPMPRQNDIPGWVAVPGWQGPAVERRQAAATDNPMVD